MKIAIPSTGKDLASPISETLGRTPYIIVYDNISEAFNTIANPGFQSKDGSGLMAVDILLQTDAGVLLTKEIGRKAYSALQAEHFKIELFDLGGTVKSVLNKYLKKQEK